MNDNAVSIIIPVKNAARTLALCLDSLARQTFHNFEIILVDNGSTDATVAMAHERSIRVLHASGRTPAARNTGAAVAHGEWLLHLDADMELDPASVAQCVAAARAGSEIVILPERNVARGYWMHAFSFGKELTRGATGCEYGRFVRRELFEQAGGYDEALLSGEDRDMALRVIAAGGRVGRIEALTLHHVEHLTIGDIVRKTANYTRSRHAFVAKHTTVAAGDRATLLGLVRRRWRTLLGSPLRAGGWLALTAFFVLRDAFMLWRMRKASERASSMPAHRSTP